MIRLLLVFVVFRSLTSFADLTVYTYDSLSGKHGLGKVVEKQFATVSKTKIKWVAFGSSGEALSQFLMEGAKGSADVLWGIDQSQMMAAKASGRFAPVRRELESELEPSILLDETRSFLPFDYGYLAFVYDSSRTKTVPVSLKDLAENPMFQKKVVIQDPRTSSLGLGLLVWTYSLWDSEKVNSFWKGFSRQLVTVSPGWSAAYGMFLKKEADFVLSYTTSPAYHIHEEKKDQYKAAIFPEGHYQQVEFAGLVKGSKSAEDGEKFLKTLVSKEVQAEVALKQWMYPVRKGTPLPESFKGLSIPKSVKVDLKKLENERKNWIQDWSRSIVKAQ